MWWHAVPCSGRYLIIAVFSRGVYDEFYRHRRPVLLSCRQFERHTRAKLHVRLPGEASLDEPAPGIHASSRRQPSVVLVPMTRGSAAPVAGRFRRAVSLADAHGLTVAVMEPNSRDACHQSQVYKRLTRCRTSSPTMSC